MSLEQVAEEASGSSAPGWSALRAAHSVVSLDFELCSATVAGAGRAAAPGPQLGFPVNSAAQWFLDVQVLADDGSLLLTGENGSGVVTVSLGSAAEASVGRGARGDVRIPFQDESDPPTVTALRVVVSLVEEASSSHKALAFAQYHVMRSGHIEGALRLPSLLLDPSQGSDFAPSLLLDLAPLSHGLRQCSIRVSAHESPKRRAMPMPTNNDLLALPWKPTVLHLARQLRGDAPQPAPRQIRVCLGVPLEPPPAHSQQSEALVFVASPNGGKPVPVATVVLDEADAVWKPDLGREGPPRAVLVPCTDAAATSEGALHVALSLVSTVSTAVLGRALVQVRRPFGALLDSAAVPVFVAGGYVHLAAQLLSSQLASSDAAVRSIQQVAELADSPPQSLAPPPAPPSPLAVVCSVEEIFRQCVHGVTRPEAQVRILYTALALALDDSMCVSCVRRNVLDHISSIVPVALLESCVAHVLTMASRPPPDALFAAVACSVVAAVSPSVTTSSAAPFLARTWSGLFSRTLALLQQSAHVDPATSWCVFTRAWPECGLLLEASSDTQADAEAYVASASLSFSGIAPSMAADDIDAVFASWAFLMKNPEARRHLGQLLLRHALQVLDHHAARLVPLRDRDGLGALTRALFTDRVLLSSIAHQPGLRVQALRAALALEVAPDVLGGLLGALSELGVLAEMLFALTAEDRVAAAGIVARSAAALARRSPIADFADWVATLPVVVRVLVESDLSGDPDQDDLWRSLLVACVSVGCLRGGVDALVARRLALGASFPGNIAAPAAVMLLLRGMLSGVGDGPAVAQCAQALLDLASAAPGTANAISMLAVLDASRALLPAGLGAADAAPPMEPFASRGYAVNANSVNGFLAAVDALSALHGGEGLGPAFGSLIEARLLLLQLRQPFGMPPGAPPAISGSDAEDGARRSAAVALYNTSLIPSDPQVDGSTLAALDRLEGLLRACCVSDDVPKALRQRLVDEADVLREERRLRSSRPVSVVSGGALLEG